MNKLLFAVLALASVGAANAQVKIAVINTQKALLETEDIKKAQMDLEAKFKPRQDGIDTLNREIQALADQLQKNQGKLTATAEADLTAQGQRKQRELQRATDDLQADATAYRNDVLSKISQKMTDVVKKLADEKGYDLVVEASASVFFKTALDITKDAIAAYDKQYPAK